MPSTDNPPNPPPDAPTPPPQTKRDFAVLCLAAAVASAGVNEDGSAVGVSEVALKSGARVAIFTAGALSPVATFNGDVNALINDLAQHAHPLGVRVRSRDVERTLKQDGVKFTANVPELTLHLVDG